MADGSRWRRLLGGRDSWRRVIVGGAGVGVTLAFIAALIAGLVSLGGGGSLGPATPTGLPAPIGGGPTEVLEPTATQELLPTPTEELLPTEPLAPTATPPLEPTETLPAAPTVTPPPEPTPE